MVRVNVTVTDVADFTLQSYAFVLIESIILALIKFEINFETPQKRSIFSENIHL